MTPAEKAETVRLSGGAAGAQVAHRHRRGRAWLGAIQAATLVAIVALSALVFNILNSSMGLVVYETAVDPETLSPDGTPVRDLPAEELVLILEDNLRPQRIMALESRKPLAERGQRDLYAIVEEEVIQPEVLHSYSAIASISSSVSPCRNCISGTPFGNTLVPKIEPLILQLLAPATRRIPARLASAAGPSHGSA